MRQSTYKSNKQNNKFWGSQTTNKNCKKNLKHTKLKAFRLSNEKSEIKSEFAECSRVAHTVPVHAKCLSQLLNGNFTGKTIHQRVTVKSIIWARSLLIN